MHAPSPPAIRAALARHEPIEVPALPGRTNHLRAGVAVPLIWRPDGALCALSTLRPAELARHAGEVCWPGGRPDPADSSYEETAIRELREELGVREVEVLGRLSSIPIYTSDYRLEPFVVRIDENEVAPDPREVARVIAHPLAALLDAPSLPAIPTELRGEAVMAPIFDAEGRTMFGGTAYVFYELLRLLAPLFGVPLPPFADSGVRWPDLLGTTPRTGTG
jgi:8-oxo-dGTP pyrophosphatase MutT (NUDIX family)